MKLVEGWHIPDHMTTANNHLRRSAVIDVAISYLNKERLRVAVQAGGHIGIWPKILSEHFQDVYTWEPMQENWECLVANCKDTENITMTQRCLGHQSAEAMMRYSRKNTGKHCIALDGTEPTIVDRLEDFSLLRTKPVDAIFLDIEGYEMYALQGAERILKTSRPMLVLEENGLNKRYSISDRQISQFMSSIGYKRMEQWEEDVIYLHESRV